jgi:hypothetical protein
MAEDAPPPADGGGDAAAEPPSEPTPAKQPTPTSNGMPESGVLHAGGEETEVVPAAGKKYPFALKRMGWSLEEVVDRIACGRSCL